MLEGPEKEALRLLRLRDPRGFEIAYQKYAARLHAFLLRLSGRREVADDLLQQTFLRLAERGPDLRPDSDLRAWLFTVARNAHTSLLRSTPASGEESLEALSSPPPDVESRLLLGDVEGALSRLRVEDRELLLLVGVEGLEPATVASMLGLSQVALRQRLARARSRLLAELGGAGARPGDAPLRRTSWLK
jgi:RNA polymerase sigma factor (sigma-70 family)